MLDKDPEINHVLFNFTTGYILINPKDRERVQAIIHSIEPGVMVGDYTSAESAAEPEEEKIYLPVIAAALVLLIVGIVFNQPLHNTPYSLAEYVVLLGAYLLVGWKVIRAAVINIVKGNVFEENFLMTVSTAGAILIHQLPEAAAVMLFYSVGEYLQEAAVNRSRRSIKELISIRPDYANLNKNGELLVVAPEVVKPGDVIVIKAGEKIPLDGNVVEGRSFLDTSALTGEPVPRRVESGDQVLAGMINGPGMLTVRVSKPFADSSVARILEMVENASTRKAPAERFITRFSAVYTPAVVGGAALLAFIPPLLLEGASFSEWIYRALVLLVISCPCALVISIPLGYFGGIGAASRRGILVKGANYLNALSNLHTVVFDKTGTLTRGVFAVTEIEAGAGFTKEQVLKLAAIAESHSNHPIGRSIMEAYQGECLLSEKIESYQEIPGQGIKVTYRQHTILAGGERLLVSEGITPEIRNGQGTTVYVAVDGKFAGRIRIADELKLDASRAIRYLKKLGVKSTVLLSGDDNTVVQDTASQLGIDQAFGNLLPEDKVTRVEELIKNLPVRGRLAFVGDGINDAPVLTRADVGIAMGALGSDAAIEAADLVIMDDHPSRIAEAVAIALKTRSIVIQNIVMALGIKAFFLVMGAMGAASMWEAVFADVGVAILAVLNASRMMRNKAGYPAWMYKSITK